MLQNFLRSEIGKIVALFLVWRLTLFGVGFLAQTLLPKIQAGTITFAQVNFLSSWANWDGGHFLGISQNGFKFIQQHAFFPAFPALIKLASPIFFGNLLISGLVVSNIAALISAIFFFKLARLDFDKNLSFRSLTYLLFFPTAFFLGAVYSEPLFLASTLSAFYFIRKGNFPIAAVSASFATLTKPYGVLIVLPLVVEYFLKKKFRLKIEPKFLPIFAPILIFILYLIYLKNSTGDPLIFIKVQEQWLRVATNPLITLWNYYTSFFTTQLNIFFGLKLIELASTVFVLGVIIASFGKMRLSYFLYILLLFLIFVSTGNLTSFSRFILILWPVFFVIAAWGENFLFDFFYKLIGLTLLGLFTGLFLSGFFIG